MKNISIAAVFMASVLFAAVQLEAQIMVVGSLTHEQQASPGSGYAGVIKIQNAGNAIQSVRVYQQDYLFYADGRVLYPEAGTIQRSNAPWISFRPNTLSIGPGQNRDISYRVFVPEEEQRGGTFWSVIMVETVSSGENGNGEFTIRQVMRYAVQIVTQLGKGVADITVLDAGLENKKGQGTALVIDLTNTGSSWIHPDVSVELFSLQDGILGPYTAPRKRIFPSTSMRFTVPLTGLSGGQYQAMAVIGGKEEEVFVVHYELEVN